MPIRLQTFRVRASSQSATPESPVSNHRFASRQTAPSAADASCPPWTAGGSSLRSQQAPAESDQPTKDPKGMHGRRRDGFARNSLATRRIFSLGDDHRRFALNSITSATAKASHSRSFWTMTGFLSCSCGSNFSPDSGMGECQESPVECALLPEVYISYENKMAI